GVIRAAMLLGQNNLLDPARGKLASGLFSYDSCDCTHSLSPLRGCRSDRGSRRMLECFLAHLVRALVLEKDASPHLEHQQVIPEGAGFARGQDRLAATLLRQTEIILPEAIREYRKIDVIVKERRRRYREPFLGSIDHLAGQVILGNLLDDPFARGTAQ